jgi:hypothetical protein
MVKTIQHDPYALFGHALSENDWVLADLLADHLASDEVARLRLSHELEISSARPGKPGSLPDLQRLARLTRGLDLEDDSG